MNRFRYDEDGSIVDTYNDCRKFETPKEILDLVNDMAASIEALELKATAYEKISEFAYDLISKTLSDKLTNLDTMLAMKQLLGDLTKTMDRITDNINDLNQ
ncbi:MAG: hypothetical protein IJ258_04200 [Methanobrevibacter sp.]|uniref:hypothetical protein n=1 Tax=Methanobrevibacter sp. TaxID=66852 RepID=UPI0025F19A8E|nr:hypothetical protein [Methanobrevibacter sp.]MBQ8017290.1 hypothetical protein [Methanobrevibacter sp.]